MGSVKATIYDLMMRMARKQLEPRRRQVVAAASGTTLELGIGTGQNLRFYPSGTRVFGVDPDRGMLDRAVERGRETPAAVHFVAASGEALPFRDACFDEVVVTLVL